LRSFLFACGSQKQHDFRNTVGKLSFIPSQLVLHARRTTPSHITNGGMTITNSRMLPACQGKPAEHRLHTLQPTLPGAHLKTIRTGHIFDLLYTHKYHVSELSLCAHSHAMPFRGNTYNCGTQTRKNNTGNKLKREYSMTIDG
jgi:hypothetical protein